MPTTSQTSAKRKPGGKCKQCGTAILTRLMYCPECKVKVAAAGERAEKNMHAFRATTGEVRDLALPKPWFSQAMVFEPHPPGGRRPPLADPCGPFLEALLGIVFARPPYIHPDDVYRYAAWIDSFRHFSHTDYSGPKSRDVPVEVLPLSRLGAALSAWVRDELHNPNGHILGPTWALDTANFIHAHAFGYYGHGYRTPAWRIRGLIDCERAHRGESFELNHASYFKNEMTRVLKNTWVRCRVPEAGSVPGRDDRETVFRAGEFFIFVIMRCYLTQGNGSEPPATLMGVPPRDYDIAADFEFRGFVLGGLDPEHTGSLEDHDNRQSYPAIVPIRWITHVRQWNETGRRDEFVAVPDWTAPVRAEPDAAADGGE